MLAAGILALAHAGSLDLILNEPMGRSAPMDRCDRPVCSSLVSMINSATTSVDMAFYGIRNQSELMAAVVAAKNRGVTVRAVVDMDVENQNYYTSTPVLLANLPGAVQTDYKIDFANGQSQRSYSGIQYRCERPMGFNGPLQCLAMDVGKGCFVAGHVSREEISFKGDIMHNKFVIVDDRYLWTGSTNASDSGTGGYNANLVMKLDSPTVAGWYKYEFEQMYTQGLFHKLKGVHGPNRAEVAPGVHVEAYFSPQDKPLTNVVRPLVQAARESIDVAVFFLTHKHLAQDLIDAKLRGVKVRVILDATAATNGYTKHEVLREAGIPVKVEDWGGKMHAKSAVIDGEIVVGGSMNWTGAGDDKNDENTLVIRSESHAAQFSRWFDAMWSDIDDRWLQGRPDPEGRESKTACSDGVDNDYDHLADGRDPGCSSKPPELPPLPPYKILPKGENGCHIEDYQAQND